jgi:hypothetical protein
MVEPVSTVLLITWALNSIIAASAVMAIVIVVTITFSYVVEWFLNKQTLVQSDTNNVAFTLKQKINDGELKTIQGIFNKTSEKVIEGRVIKSKNMDKDFLLRHENEDLIIYE